MRDEKGMTLTELVTVVAVGSLLMSTAIVFALPMIARETMRSAVHDTTSFLQLARMEAASRNRPCRFTVNTSTGSLEVWDMNGTDDTDDDLQLHVGRIPNEVIFQRPDSGAPVTLAPVDLDGTYAAVFTPSGVVSAGAGEVVYQGGGAFGRIALHAAGGLEITYWSGSHWGRGI
jgi:prepilin-type N-terminal cleavage/methylation domain-containing protein